jgi:hypothetical protein
MVSARSSIFTLRVVIVRGMTRIRQAIGLIRRLRFRIWLGVSVSFTRSWIVLVVEPVAGACALPDISDERRHHIPIVVVRKKVAQRANQAGLAGYVFESAEIRTSFRACRSTNHANPGASSGVQVSRVKLRAQRSNFDVYFRLLENHKRNLSFR